MLESAIYYIHSCYSVAATRCALCVLVIVMVFAKTGLSVEPSMGRKKRVIVLTDFFKDPDDKQSMVRFLTYSNEFDAEGLIATSLAYGTGEVHPEWIEGMIDEYGKVLGNLRKHERQGFEYPSVGELKSVVKEAAHVVRELRVRNRGFAVPYPEGAKDSRSCEPAEKWIGPDKDTTASK